MKSIKMLDCTLRDGGYCNQWQFGKENIHRIMQGLIESGIDIIECGFLSNRISVCCDSTKFCSLSDIENTIPDNCGNSMFVCMINYGEYELDDIPLCDGSGITGIRVAFHKKDLKEALDFCKGVQEKGYLVFVQAMVSLSYEDEEFLTLIREINSFTPYAFYIVDSFGVMKRKDLLRLFYMVEHNLKDGIYIGFHSHNNMQLAYSNAQAIVDNPTMRNIIIDSSVYGMGRGAGNLNTELFVGYLNDSRGATYLLKPLLNIIDDILNGFYQQNAWGYSLPNYLSAKHNIHPNYASYLDAKKTLTIEGIDELFSMMDEGKKVSYDKTYIERLYIQYMSLGQSKETHLKELEERYAGKEVVLLAPGHSLVEEEERIINFIDNMRLPVICINFDFDEVNPEFLFVSNRRRFKKLAVEKHNKCITTSNILSPDVYLNVEYKDLLNEESSVRDNAGLMAIKFLMRLGVKKIYIAGMDGLSSDPTQNYVNKELNFYSNRELINMMNVGMGKVLNKYCKEIDIEFITKPKHIEI